MPKQALALEPGGAKRLMISYGMNWKNISVMLDGRELGVIPDQKALKAGRSFTLDDGSTLSVQLVRNGIATELRVLRNGQPLPGSASDPNMRLTTSYGMVFTVGCMGVIAGLAGELGDVEFLRTLGAGWFSVAGGVALIGLGFLVRRRNLLALLVAMGLYALDAVMALTFPANVEDGQPPTMGFIVHLFFLVIMYQGVGAIKELNRTKTP